MPDPTPSRTSRSEDAPAPGLDLHHDVVDLRREMSRLRDALAGRASVEQATGMLMLAYGYGPDRAATVLHGWATDLGVSPRAVAEGMVEAIDTAVEADAREGRGPVPMQRLPGQ